MSFIIIPSTGTTVSAFQIDYTCNATYTGSGPNPYTLVTWAASPTIASAAVARTSNTVLTLNAGTYELFVQFEAVSFGGGTYAFVRSTTNDGTTATNTTKSVTAFGDSYTDGVPSLIVGNRQFGFVFPVANTFTLSWVIGSDSASTGTFSGHVYLLKTA